MVVYFSNLGNDTSKKGLLFKAREYESQGKADDASALKELADGSKGSTFLYADTDGNGRISEDEFNSAALICDDEKGLTLLDSKKMSENSTLGLMVAAVGRIFNSKKLTMVERPKDKGDLLGTFDIAAKMMEASEGQNKTKADKEAAEYATLLENFSTVNVNRDAGISDIELYDFLADYSQVAIKDLATNKSVKPKDPNYEALIQVMANIFELKPDSNLYGLHVMARSGGKINQATIKERFGSKIGYISSSEDNGSVITIGTYKQNGQLDIREISK